MGNMADGLNMRPRPGEPESALEPGMAAPRSARGCVGAVTPRIHARYLNRRCGTATAGTMDTRFRPRNRGLRRATFNGEVNFASGRKRNLRRDHLQHPIRRRGPHGGGRDRRGRHPNPNAALDRRPTAPTATAGDSSTKIATTAFVGQAVAAGAGVTAFNGRQGTVALTAGDITDAGGVTNPNAALTGMPTAPTAVARNAATVRSQARCSCPMLSPPGP